MSDHDDFAMEPVPGLPEAPPKGEEVLWQGRPDTLALAQEALGLGWVAGYFVLLAVWRVWAAGDGSVGSAVALMLPYLAIGLVTCAILLGIAYLYSRTTIYTLTNARVAMRIGAALTVTLNLPFTQIANASLDLKRRGTGTIALETMGNTRLAYLVCWPHVRPWHLSRTQPALRCIPDAARVAQMLAEAADSRISQPVVTRQPMAVAVAAE